MSLVVDRSVKRVRPMEHLVTHILNSKQMSWLRSRTIVVKLSLLVEVYIRSLISVCNEQ
jgi:hypothetical protein